MKSLIKVIRLMGDNIELIKEKNQLEKKVYEVYEECEKYKRELEEKNEKMNKRNDTLAKDNRILMTTIRKKDKQIIELKKELKHEQELKDNALKMYDELLEGEDKDA